MGHFYYQYKTYHLIVHSLCNCVFRIAFGHFHFITFRGCHAIMAAVRSLTPRNAFKFTDHFFRKVGVPIFTANIKSKTISRSYFPLRFQRDAFCHYFIPFRIDRSLHFASFWVSILFLWRKNGIFRQCNNRLLHSLDRFDCYIINSLIYHPMKFFLPRSIFT